MLVFIGEPINDDGVGKSPFVLLSILLGDLFG